LSAIAQFSLQPESLPAELLNAAFDACPEGLALAAAGRLLYANAAFAGLFALPQKAGLQNSPLAQLFPPEILERCAMNARAASRVSEPLCVEIRAGANAAARTLHLSISAFACEQREMLLLAAHPAAQCGPSPEAQRLQALGRMVGSVAHDFNNLLTGILLYCDLLHSRLEPASPLRAYVEEVRRAGMHSAELVQQLMSAAQSSREDSGSASWEQIIREMRNLLARLLGESIELAMEVSPDAAAVPLSRTQMRQIVLNLLLNARDAMPQGGKIAIAIRNLPQAAATSDRPPAWVEFAVADNGCGMDAATRARAFDPFFTTKATKGNGLGLSTVHRIVRENAGTIKLESQPGEGTRVTVCLPAALAPTHLHQSSYSPKGR
jgi:signal transduction histidine kinase